jgi:hypothetical protein
VYICGKKRHGLISDEELSGLRIGLVCSSQSLAQLFFFFVFIILDAIMGCRQI